MAWTQTTGLDLWSSLDSADSIVADEDASVAMDDPNLMGMPTTGHGYTMSNSFPTGFITYRAPFNTMSDMDESGNSQDETPAQDESLDLVFEATGAGYPGRGFSRFLGASSGVELGAIVSGATASLAQQTYVASISPLQGGFGAVASRESSAADGAQEEETEENGNQEGTTEPVIVGGSAEPGSEETSLAANNSGETGDTTDNNDSQPTTEPGTQPNEGKPPVEVVEVDEPSTLILFGLGLFGLGLMSKRSRKGLLQA